VGLPPDSREQREARILWRHGARARSLRRGIDEQPYGDGVGFDPKGMVFIVYADGTVNGTDRVIAAVAPNGGFNVTSTYLLSDGSAGRKFLPWSCAEGKNLWATWYDRRAATQAAPI